MMYAGLVKGKQKDLFSPPSLVFKGLQSDSRPQSRAEGLSFGTCCAPLLAAVRYLRKNGAKTVAIVGGSFGGSAAADASITSQPGEINGLALLAADWNGPAERLKAPLLVIVARDDANDEGLRLPRIRAWFDRAPQPKKLLVLEGSAHAQFLFQTNQSDRVMRELLQFLSATNLHQ